MKEHQNTIKAAAQLAHDLHELHRSRPSDPTFEQVGFLDGRDTVLDYLDHGELGVALQHLLYMIHEANISFPAAVLHTLHDIAAECGVVNPYSLSEH